MSEYPRWRLACAHYIMTSIPSTWEYSELDRQTGKNKKKVFNVPTLLDPNDPGDWNYKSAPDEGEIIVTNFADATGKDIIFIGDPTPDMVPLNDAAKVISASFAERWKQPVESIENNYGDSLVKNFEAEMSKIQSAPQKVEIDGMAEMLSAMTAMMKQNADLIAAIAKPAERRV